MSADQSQSTLQSRLDALQCHFTWDLDSNRSKLLRLKDKLLDIGTEEGNLWLGHIYNLQGFIHHQLGEAEEARSLFISATDALRRLKRSDQRPWMVVNYGNLAWLHHSQGKQEESQSYLQKVDDLLSQHPPPTEDELHPEVCAEKAWTLMKFGKEKKLLAVDYFQKALRMQPDRVEWRTTYALLWLTTYKHFGDSEAEVLKEVRRAREEDPENTYLAVVDLNQRAMTGEQIEDEALELSTRILANPVSSYSGIKPLLRLYRHYISVDEAINLANEALKNHPDSRYLKRCAALCYKWRIMFFKGRRPSPAVFDRAIRLHKDVISLYPQCLLVEKIDLANILGKSDDGLGEAGQIYGELLSQDLGPLDLQMVYNNYAKFLNFDVGERLASIRYHMKVAEIPNKSFHRQNSIKVLENIRGSCRDPLAEGIDEFLENLERNEAEGPAE